ncbi:MAG TPA: hypothetical protein VGW76_03855 [Pyrinomonadaceae bacterium]|nr:hypothetical protein [Pyrinomonadaceae bacterium]
MLSLQAKTNLVSLRSISLVLILVPGLLSSVSYAVTPQQTAARELSFPVAIQWNKQTGVRRYRLQIAADEKFQNIFFDGLVTGERYVASELPAGSYFWRVASADSNLKHFSPAVCFFVSGGIVTHVALPNRVRSRR